MEYTEEFLRFWRQYPKRWNSNLHTYVKRKKWPAFESWMKLSAEIQAEILAKAFLIRRSEGTPRDAVTWLNQKGWDDIELPKPPPKQLPAGMTSVFKSVPSAGMTDKKVNDRRNEEMAKIGVKP